MQYDHSQVSSVLPPISCLCSYCLEGTRNPTLYNCQKRIISFQLFSPFESPFWINPTSHSPVYLLLLFAYLLYILQTDFYLATAACHRWFLSFLGLLPCLIEYVFIFLQLHVLSEMSIHPTKVESYPKASL